MGQLSWVLPPSLGRIAAAERAERLCRALGPDVRVRIASNYEDLERSIMHAEADLVWAPPAISARVFEHAHAVMKAIRAGRDHYYGALIVPRRGPSSIEELAGTDPAWVDALSASGYLLARACLRRRGLDPDRALGFERFYGSYALACRAVLDQRAAFCAVYAQDDTESAVVATLGRLVGIRADELRTLAFTDSTPNDGLVVTRRPEAADTKARIDAWFADGSGRELLEQLDAESLVAASSEEFEVLRRAL